MLEFFLFCLNSSTKKKIGYENLPKYSQRLKEKVQVFIFYFPKLESTRFKLTTVDNRIFITRMYIVYCLLGLSYSLCVCVRACLCEKSIVQFDRIIFHHHHHYHRFFTTFWLYVYLSSKKNHISYLNCGTIFWLNETNNFMAYIISDSKA